MCPEGHCEGMEDEVTLGSPNAILACVPQVKAYLQTQKRLRYLQMADFLKTHTC